MPCPLAEDAGSGAGGARQLRTVGRLFLPHQAADGDDVSVLTRTMLSVSLDAAGGEGQAIDAERAQVDHLSFSATVLMAGVMWRMMLPSSSICGVTSSEMPEK